MPLEHPLSFRPTNRCRSRIRTWQVLRSWVGLPGETCNSDCPSPKLRGKGAPIQVRCSTHCLGSHRRTVERDRPRRFRSGRTRVDQPHSFFGLGPRFADSDPFTERGRRWVARSARRRAERRFNSDTISATLCGSCSSNTVRHSLIQRADSDGEILGTPKSFLDLELTFPRLSDVFPVYAVS